MTDFNGWNMPLMYSSMTQEHLFTRSSAGVFDLGHMGRLLLSGAGAIALVDRLTPIRLSAASRGDVLYSFVLRETGRPIDDITVYYEADDRVLLVVNASNRVAVIDWLRDKCAAAGVTLEDKTFDWGMIALQGPDHERVMRAVFGAAFTPCAYYRFYRLPDGVILSATGYTGETGYEIYAPQARIPELWQAFVDAGALPVGLGARDTLRLEAALPLFGHELNDDVTPLEAGFGRFVDFEKGDFIGRDALLKQKEAGITKKLIGYELAAAHGPIGRAGMGVKDSDGNTIGVVTSGCLSPSLKKIIGMAYVDTAHSAVGTKICLDIRGRLQDAVVVKKPFYKRSK